MSAENRKFQIIGAGLAGVEAANFLAARGVKVSLYEMKPKKYSPAHKYGGFAELVCSNSLKAFRLNSAPGMLKEEMRLFGSLTMEAARETAVSAGGALAVDREKFSDYITEKISANPFITVINKEYADFPEKDAIICTGPLTSGDFAEKIRAECGGAECGFMNFYDAAAPIVTRESVDFEKVFFAARYGKGEADYINCPFGEAEYDAFYEALISAERAPLHDFDARDYTESGGKIKVYEGCMPVEILAGRGKDSLRYGCMKPVGLTDPKTGKRPYAVVQLRSENAEGSLYNIVGFQTNLKYGEQKRVFSMIPGLENAEFVRYGTMHRNTFINSPKLLGNNYKLKNSNNIYFAGQITGVEGYCESAASGLVSAFYAYAGLCGKGELPPLPATSMTGALARYISDESIKDFQPMGANMGILPPLSEAVRDKQKKYEMLSGRGIADLREYLNKYL